MVLPRRPSTTSPQYYRGIRGNPAVPITVQLSLTRTDHYDARSESDTRIGSRETSCDSARSSCVSWPFVSRDGNSTAFTDDEPLLTGVEIRRHAVPMMTSDRFRRIRALIYRQGHQIGGPERPH